MLFQRDPSRTNKSSPHMSIPRWSSENDICIQRRQVNPSTCDPDRAPAATTTTTNFTGPIVPQADRHQQNQ